MRTRFEYTENFAESLLSLSVLLPLGGYAVQSSPEVRAHEHVSRNKILLQKSYLIPWASSSSCFLVALPAPQVLEKGPEYEHVVLLGLLYY